MLGIPQVAKDCAEASVAAVWRRCGQGWGFCLAAGGRGLVDSGVEAVVVCWQDC